MNNLIKRILFVAATAITIMFMNSESTFAMSGEQTGCVSWSKEEGCTIESICGINGRRWVCIYFDAKTSDELFTVEGTF